MPQVQTTRGANRATGLICVPTKARCLHLQALAFQLITLCNGWVKGGSSCEHRRVTSCNSTGRPDKSRVTTVAAGSSQFVSKLARLIRWLSGEPEQSSPRRPVPLLSWDTLEMVEWRCMTSLFQDCCHYMLSQFAKHFFFFLLLYQQHASLNCPFTNACTQHRIKGPERPNIALMKKVNVAWHRRPGWASKPRLLGNSHACWIIRPKGYPLWPSNQGAGSIGGIVTGPPWSHKFKEIYKLLFELNLCLFYFPLAGLNEPYTN